MGHSGVCFCSWGLTLQYKGDEHASIYSCSTYSPFTYKVYFDALLLSSVLYCTYLEMGGEGIFGFWGERKWWRGGWRGIHGSCFDRLTTARGERYAGMIFRFTYLEPIFSRGNNTYHKNRFGNGDWMKILHILLPCEKCHRYWRFYTWVYKPMEANRSRMYCKYDTVISKCMLISNLLWGSFLSVMVPPTNGASSESLW